MLSHPSKSNVKVLLTSILIDLFGFTSILPLFPAILNFYQNHDESSFFKNTYNSVVYFRSSILNAPEILTTSNSSNLVNHISVDSVLLGGFLGSWFSFLQFISNPIYTKKFTSSKKAIIISLLGSCFSSLIWYNSDSFFLFFLARTLGGLFEGNVTISISILGQVVDPKLKKFAMAAVGICYSLAFILGPLIGVKLSYILNDLFTNNFYQLPAIFSCFCSLLAALVILKFYEDVEIKKSASESSQVTNDENKSSKFAITKHQTLPKIYFIYLLAFSGVEFSISFLLLEKYNFNRVYQGRIFSIMGLLMAAMQGGYVRKKAGYKLCKNSSFLLFISFVFLSLSKLNICLAGLSLKAIAAAGMVPSFNLMASEIGYNLAKLRSVGALARSIGPLLFCSLYWIFNSFYCFFSGSLCMILVYFMLKEYDVREGLE